MKNEDFEEIMKNIKIRKPLIEKYVSEGGYGPTSPTFDEWLKIELRDQKLNKLLNEK